MSVETLEPRYAEKIDMTKDFDMREGLGWKARKELRELLTIARGVMLIYGDAGQGKDLFGVSLCARFKYFFKRRILLDFLPYEEFDRIDGGGDYILFNAERMTWEISKMAKEAKVGGIETSADPKESDEFISEATRKWATEGEGEILLRGAVLYLSELKRYCYNRNPHNRFNKFIGSLCDVWRHLDLLILGTHILPHEIDRNTFLKKSKLRAKCEWSLAEPDTTIVTVRRGAFAVASGVFVAEGKPLIVKVNGSKPYDWLNGNSFFELYPSKNMMNLRPVMSKAVK